MALHSKDNFIVPISEGDQVIFIQDKNGSITFKVNPWRVTSTWARSCFIFAKLQGTDNPLQIKFSSDQEALEALTIFQRNMDLLKSETSDISNEIINLIDTRLLEISNTLHFAFHQEIPSDTWLVQNHGLKKKSSVTVTNDDFEKIVGWVKFIDDDNILVKFNQELTGWVFLN